ncbi:unnamed protein product [Brassica rapa]|uniref:Uncharacterized protein n=2 Tax=Brassica TaxID=3705 RepID=A0A8D9DMM4_BRACM|nr:unnamed protein product [Brassica napus]CAG7876462.1 unnamed protein product [Brassica rapa]
MSVVRIVSGWVKQRALVQLHSTGAAAESANPWIGCLKYTNDAAKSNMAHQFLNYKLLQLLVMDED